jgi:23S rRNA (pseudouridine1915-N3)-methyltransferase
VAKDYQLNLIEIPTMKRVKSANIKLIIQMESQKLLKATSPNSLIIALDERGQEWTTWEFAHRIATWHREQQEISFLIGGPDGWEPSCLKNIPIIWSLSKLTLPHQLVRVMVAEQIYRAWSIINKHPYHRN